jgi:septation ring formation regulator EzrA
MASEKENKNGWNEYSRLVLAELENLNTKFQHLSEELTEARQDIIKNGTQIKRVQDEIKELKEWRKDVSEIVSPTQLKEVRRDVDKLKTFKTISTTAWVIVQILFGIAIALFGVFKTG